jgi:hypothetical protein
MLLERAEAPDSPDRAHEADFAASPTEAHELGSPIQDDVERLIEIAGQLFGAIERQIHHIEQDLNFSQSKGTAQNGQTVFKEQLIRTAASLHQSLNDIAIHLGDHVSPLSSTTTHGERLILD